MPIAVVVIPTYNESESVGKMIEYLFTRTFPTIKNYQMKVLIVDGNSPDGTGEVVKKYQKKYSDLFLLTETKKEGIGAAYLKGFKYAIDQLHADFIFEFDGDFQHPPETIPLALKAIGEGYDYIIGSRKIKGGSVPNSWGIVRKFFTFIGGFSGRFIMFFPFKHFWQVTDPTTGFKVTRVKGFIDQMDLTNYSRLYSKSFGYKFQLLYETLNMGARFGEVPLQFALRTAGESKIEPQTARDVLRVAILLRWHDDFTQKFLKFAVVGGFGFFINFFGLKFFNQIFLNLPWPIGLINFFANALASELAIISNFIFNNLWTFAQEKITSPSLLITKFITFNLSSVVGGIVVPSLIIGLGTQIFGDQYRQLLLVTAIFGFTIPYNWFVYNKFIWKKKP